MVGGAFIGAVGWSASCALEPAGMPCDVTNLWGAGIGVASWLALVVIWSVAWAAPRSIARQALARATTAESSLAGVQAELAALKDRRARNKSIRERLAELVTAGDQAWNAASVAYQLWKSEQPPISYVPGSVKLGPASAVPEWWRDVEEWLSEVEGYLAQTPELGAAYVDLFRAQEGSLSEVPKGKAPLSTENRTQQDMKLIRLKQDKLRQFMDEFKG